MGRLRHDIDAVTNYTNSSLGEKMSAFARSASSDVRVASMIDEELERGLDEGDLTRVAVARVRYIVTSRLNDTFRADDLERPRVATLHYFRKTPVLLEFPSAWGELVMRLDTHINVTALQTYAVGDERRMPHTVPLVGELLLVGDGVATQRSIERSLLRSFDSCRMSANSQARHPN